MRRKTSEVLFSFQSSKYLHYWFCVMKFNMNIWLFYSWKWEEVWPPDNWTTWSHRQSMAWLLPRSMMRDLVSQCWEKQSLVIMDIFLTIMTLWIMGLASICLLLTEIELTLKPPLLSRCGSCPKEPAILRSYPDQLQSHLGARSPWRGSVPHWLD